MTGHPEDRARDHGGFKMLSAVFVVLFCLAVVAGVAIALANQKELTRKAGNMACQDCGTRGTIRATYAHQKDGRLSKRHRVMKKACSHCGSSTVTRA